MNTPASSMTGSLDNVFLYIIGISVVLLLLVTALMIYFAIRYNKKRHPRAEEVHGSTLLEIIWTAVPTILVLTMFYFGFHEFILLRQVPAGAMVVTVTGRMWEWSFEYENGRKTNQLFVPVGRPVKLLLHSLDVNHSFFIPAFRIKEDAIPGRENYLWFQPSSMGPADIFCSEFCGQRHAYMMSKVIVLSEKEFQTWYAQPTPAPAAGASPALSIMEKHDCLMCHSLDGSPGLGPTLKGIWGRKTIVIAHGQSRELVADEAYLQSAIQRPMDELVKGYANDMPVPDNLSDQDVQIIIDYLKTKR